jgi:hypothetical protein
VPINHSIITTHCREAHPRSKYREGEGRAIKQWMM